jgi:uncharacterized membrane protein required for colicin V production
MNLVDWVILGIIGISVLFGMYRGFIASVASMGGCLLSLGAGYWLSPRLAEFVRNNTTLGNTLMSYTDAATRLKDASLSSMSVAGLSAENISAILSRVSLPPPLDSLLKNNLEQEVYKATGLTQDVGHYVTQTIVSALMNVLCFVACFIAAMIVFHILLNFLKAVFRFPLLKQLNSLAGGAFGLLRGMLLCFVGFALMPLVLTIVPVEGLSEMVNASALAPLFNSGNMILSIMNGHL